jgi:putative hemolysin
VQIMARILTRASVQVFSPYLDEAALRGTHLRACDDVGGSVAAALSAAGDEATVCVLPEGPQTIAYLDRSSRP